MFLRNKLLALSSLSPCLHLAPSSRCYYANLVDTSPGSVEAYTWPSQPNPTPYQIFNCARGAPYSKRRYYELVKLYHPDSSSNCSGPSHHSLSEKIRLERFRLIVAANEILSDPHKKRAYDRYGAGWNNQPPAIGVRDHRNSRDRNYTSVDHRQQKSWWEFDWNAREGHPDPSANATWEDWERYYEAFRKYDEGVNAGAQKPTYMSNTSFFAIITVLTAVGTVAIVNHATKSSQLYIAERDRLSEQIGKELWRTKRQAVEVGNRDEQIRRFLKNRDAMLGSSQTARNINRDTNLLSTEDERSSDADARSKEVSLYDTN